MIKKLLAAITTTLICVSVYAVASQDQMPVTIAMELELDGKVVAKPRITVLMGEVGQITQQLTDANAAYAIAVQPTLGKPGTIQLDFVVKQSGASESKVLSQPRVIVQNGKSASIEQRLADQPDLKLTVTPKF